MPYFTPLRYPGGKSKLSRVIQNVFQLNNLCDGFYIEPYSGGAGVAMSLLLEGYARNIIINDIDYFVYGFWKSILDETDLFCKKILDTPVSIDTWKQQKLIHKNFAQHSLFDIGFATFFLNRTNRSGILSGGVIGGQEQIGPYRIDARYNKENLIARIKLIAKYKNRISVYNEDAMELLDKLSIDLQDKKKLFYFDPPYYKKGQCLYKNSYSSSDHRCVAEKIQKLESPWIVTYDDVKEISDLYANCLFSRFTINYSAHIKRSKGNEIMFSGNLIMPHEAIN